MITATATDGAVVITMPGATWTVSPREARALARHIKDAASAATQPAEARPPSMERGEAIIRAVAHIAGRRVSDLTGPGRAQVYFYPRIVAILALYSAGFSSPQIGRLLGGRHHTTILHAMKRAKDGHYVERDRALALASAGVPA